MKYLFLLLLLSGCKLNCEYVEVKNDNITEIVVDCKE